MYPKLNKEQGAFGTRISIFIYYIYIYVEVHMIYDTVIMYMLYINKRMYKYIFSIDISFHQTSILKHSRMMQGVVAMAARPDCPC